MSGGVGMEEKWVEEAKCWALKGWGNFVVVEM